MAETLGPGAYWIKGAGVLAAVLIRNYTGDGLNNRIIDLGDDYNRVEIRLRSAEDLNTTHLALATTVYVGGVNVKDVLIENGGGQATEHRTMAFANPYWQGKQSGPDANKIALGSNGALAGGTNINTFLYTIMAWKYSAVDP